MKWKKKKVSVHRHPRVVLHVTRTAPSSDPLRDSIEFGVAHFTGAAKRIQTGTTLCGTAFNIVSGPWRSSNGNKRHTRGFTSCKACVAIVRAKIHA